MTVPCRFASASSGSTPAAAAVPGMSWPRPRAPAGETAFGRQDDSTATSATTSRASSRAASASARTRAASRVAPPAPPVPLWISPFKGLVVSLLIVRFLSTRVYPILPAGITRLARLFARSRPLRLAHEPDRAAVLLGDLLDRELGRRDDRAHVL